MPLGNLEAPTVTASAAASRRSVTPRRRRRPSLFMMLLMGWVVVLGVVIPVTVFLARNHILFFPAARPLPDDALASFGGVSARIVRVVRPDGRKLAAYDVTPAGLAADAPVVLFLHGNAGNIATRASLAAEFASMAGVRLLMLDYSGFGGNEGSPSEAEISIDALAAYDYAISAGVPASRIVVFGESIGGGPALVVATQRRVAGVVLQSAISSLSSMAWRVYPWMPLLPLLARGSFRNCDRIATLTVPVLIAHGMADTVVPSSEGEALHAACPRAEFLRVARADHNDFFQIAGTAHLRDLGERFRRWTSGG